MCLVSGIHRDGDEADYATVGVALFVLAACRNADITVYVYADIEHDRSTAHLAVFNITLFGQGIVNQYGDAFSTVRATDEFFAEFVAVFGVQSTSVT